MSMNHEKLVEAAKEAVNKVFGDTSVDKHTTMESLEDIMEDIISDIDTMLDTLDERDEEE